MPHDAVHDRAGMPVAAVERLPVAGERAESLLEGLEQHQVSPEKRFAELKNRLQEVNATLVGSEQMIETMREDLKKMQELKEDASEEAIQFTEYIAEIDQAKAEQARLQTQLERLTSGKDKVALEQSFAQSQATEDREALAAKSALTLDDLDAARAQAIASGDRMMEEHLDGEMADRYKKMEVVAADSPEARAMGEVGEAKRIVAAERAQKDLPESLHETAVLAKNPDAQDAQQAAEAVVVPTETGAAEVAVDTNAPGLEEKRAELLALSVDERQNLFERLILDRKWSQEAADGAVTDEARALQPQLHALASMIRADIAGRTNAQGERAKAELLRDWDEKIRTLSQEPTPIEVKAGREGDRFMEEWGYTSSLAKSAREEINRAGGQVTETAKDLLDKAIAIEQRQLAQLRSGEARGVFEPETRMQELTASIRELKELRGDRVEEGVDQVPQEQEPGGIDAAEGMPEILSGSKELVSGERLASVRKTIEELQEFFKSNRNYSTRLEVFSEDLGELARLSQRIDISLHGMDEALHANPPDQATFDEFIQPVGRQMHALLRRASELEEELSALGSGMKNIVSSNAEIFDVNDEDEVNQLVRAAYSGLEEIAKTISSKRARWQELEDHLAQSGRNN